MLPAPLRKAGYALCIVQGLLSAVAPRLATKLNAKLWLSGFENVDELEPKDWYLRAVRATGVGMLAAGGVALLLESRAAEDEADEEDDLEVVGLSEDEEDTAEDDADAEATHEQSGEDEE